MKKKLLLLVASIFFGLLFLLFSYLTHRNHFTQFDFDLMVKLQDRFPENLNTFFSFTILIASFEISLILLICLVLFLLLKRHWFSIFFIPIFAAGHIVEIFGKSYLEHTAPPMHFLRSADTTFFPQWYQHPISSYPSGHSFRVVFLSIILSFLIYANPRLAKRSKYVLIGVFVVFAITTAVGRSILGAHWPTDVIGGSLLGITLSFLSLVFI